MHISRRTLERLIPYCGVLAPPTKLRKAVVATAGPAAATLELLGQAAGNMDLPVVRGGQTNHSQPQASENHRGASRIKSTAARC